MLTFIMSLACFVSERSCVLQSCIARRLICRLISCRPLQHSIVSWYRMHCCLDVVYRRNTSNVPISGAAREERGKLPPYGWTSKNYVICVCFHCHRTSSYHTTNTLQGRRAKSHVDTQTIQPGLGDFVL